MVRQASRPLAVNWGFDYPQTSTEDKLDTRENANTAARYQKDMGFQAYSYISGGKPKEVIDSIAGSAIFTFSGHGEFITRHKASELMLPYAGRIVTGDTGTYPFTTHGFIVEYFKNADFSKCKFAMFPACQTTCSYKGCSGGQNMDIAALSVKYGCDVALGFSGIVAPDWAAYFVEQFWKNARKYDVLTAMENAKKAVFDKKGSFGGTDSAVLNWGEGVTVDFKLMPPSYGMP